MYIRDKVIELGGKIVTCGPNTMYACGFPTREATVEFTIWFENSFTDSTHGNPIKMEDGTFDVSYEVN